MGVKFVGGLAVWDEVPFADIEGHAIHQTDECDESIIRRLDLQNAIRSLPPKQRLAVFKRMQELPLNSIERKDLHRAAKRLKISSSLT